MTISSYDDVIDSRDIIARIDELRDSLESLPDADDAAELAALEALAEQCEGYGDWEYGEVLIRDSYFQEYAQQLAEDCGLLQRDAKWPYTCIDWEYAASELQQDYMCVDFDGVTYWMRS